MTFYVSRHLLWRFLKFLNPFTYVCIWYALLLFWWRSIVIRLTNFLWLEIMSLICNECLHRKRTLFLPCISTIYCHGLFFMAMIFSYYFIFFLCLANSLWKKSDINNLWICERFFFVAVVVIRNSSLQDK